MLILFSNVILFKNLVKMAGSKRMEYVSEYLEIILMSPGTKLVNAVYNREEIWPLLILRLKGKSSPAISVS